MTIALPVMPLAAFALIWLARRRAVLRLREMAESRRREGNAGHTVFVAYLAGLGLSPAEADEVYRYVQSWVPGPEKFPVELDDEMGRVLGICGLDVDDAAEQLARMCRCRLPAGAAFSQNQTVGDLLKVVLGERPRLWPYSL